MYQLSLLSIGEAFLKIVDSSRYLNAFNPKTNFSHKITGHRPTKT
jgi:hypothetical protein